MSRSYSVMKRSLSSVPTVAGRVAESLALRSLPMLLGFCRRRIP